MGLVDELLAEDLTDEEIEALVMALPPGQFHVLRAETMEAQAGVGPWAFDPGGYIRERLNENLWSKQREICESVRDHERTAVPAGFGAGKSHLAARIAMWWIESYTDGTGLVITTATTFRSVKGQLWGHIRRLHRRHKFAGKCNQTDMWSGDEMLALGFSAPNTSPEDVSGWHAAHILVIVDEAGGISDGIGAALEGLVSSGHARMLAIGNPSMDTQDTWFERICGSQHWNVIPLPVADTPNYTGEEPGPCMSCPVGARSHSIRTHLVSPDYAKQTADTWGEDSAWYVSKVLAQFPEVTANTTIPLSWLEESFRSDAEPQPGARVRLGVDVASEGGDELAIARAEGMRVQLVSHSSGPHLANDVDVSGIVLKEIHEAERRAQVLADMAGVEPEPVRVKIEAVGTGHGVCSILEKWGEEGMHKSVIVRVQPGGSAFEPDKFSNARSEMWWTGRKAVQPVDGGSPEWRFDVDVMTLKQLAGPKNWTNSQGRTIVEPKEQMKKRGRGSPDRGDAVLLAVYEPAPVKPKFRKLRIVC